MAKWYGSVQNRIEENKMFTDEIKVGTGVTEYSWSDREAYEVIEVRDQKHVTIRRYDHKHIGKSWADNEWELISNPDNPTIDLVKRGKYWYSEVTCTKDYLDSLTDEMDKARLVINGFDLDKVREKGKQTRYHRMNVSFGKADYYYDYEF